MVAGPTLRGQNFLWINENVDYPLIWHLERHSDNNSRENPFTACILGGQFQVAVRAVLVALSPSKSSPMGFQLMQEHQLVQSYWL